jgi:hypothetical protein
VCGGGARTGGWLVFISPLFPIGSETDMSGSSFDPPVVNTWDLPVMPYVDMTINRSGKTLSDYFEDTVFKDTSFKGSKGFALAFVGVKEGTTNFTWGGFKDYPAPDHFKTEIDNFVADGGIPVISFGGAQDILPCSHLDGDPLFQGYKDVITGYNIRHINFDIEQVSGHVVRPRNVDLVTKLLETFKDLHISYSFEVNTGGDEVGIQRLGLNLLDNLAEKGIVPGLVNLLIEYLPTPHWDVAQKVMEAAQTQLAKIYKDKDIHVDDIWGHIGACPLYKSEDWAIDDQKSLRVFADDNKIKLGCLSGWSTNADVAYEYAYEKILNDYHR